MSHTSTPFRKAAILVSSLDNKSADALLDQMPADQAARVRQAVMELAEIDPAEQQQIIAEFVRRQSGPAETEGVEIDLSLVRKFSPASGGRALPNVATQPEPARPFRFLHDAASDTICKLLQREHPQTVALVVAHLPPVRAAEILGQLPAQLQTDVLRRIADLDETSPDVLRELEQSLQTLLAHELRAGRRRSAGVVAVGAILSAATEISREEILANLTQADAELVARLTPEPAAQYEASDTRKAKAPRRPFFWSRSPAAAIPATTTAAAPSPVEMASDDQDEEPYDDDSEVDTELEEPLSAANPPLPVVAFDDLMRLDNRALALVLKAADPRIAILALTGARRELVDRLLKQLSLREATAFRKQMEQSGPLRLRDVEVAQGQLALVASRLIARGDITLPVVKRFAAAA